MGKVYSKALNKTLNIERVIGRINGSKDGPTIIFIAGIHGNEPSGVFALDRVLKHLNSNNISVKGNIYALSGNLWALERGVRFDKQDLNRMWFSSTIDEISKNKSHPDNEEVKQQHELYTLINAIFEKETGPFYFMDLHTTSGSTIPFITVNDSLLNREFTQQFPLPIILGIEEYLEGPLLSYINEIGYVAFGYEAGQHDDISSIDNHEAFIYLSLVFTGCINQTDIEYDKIYHQLSDLTKSSQEFYEIFYRYQIQKNETFTMNPGFKNFQAVSKGTDLAISDGHKITATITSKIFMPLYQKQGDDGFFAIRKIPRIFLKLSSLFRKIHLDNVLTIFPGISWESKNHDVLVVNRNIARFFAKQFFHLMGYRSKRLEKKKYLMKMREVASKEKDYKFALWKKKQF